MHLESSSVVRMGLFCHQAAVLQGTILPAVKGRQQASFFCLYDMRKIQQSGVTSIEGKFLILFENQRCIAIFKDLERNVSWWTLLCDLGACSSELYLKTFKVQDFGHVSTCTAVMD